MKSLLLEHSRENLFIDARRLLLLPILIDLVAELYVAVAQVVRFRGRLRFNLCQSLDARVLLGRRVAQVSRGAVQASVLRRKEASSWIK